MKKRSVTVRIATKDDPIFDPARPVEIRIADRQQTHVIVLSYKEATQLADALDELRE